MDTAANFPGRLRELREKAGLTQQELADKAGLKIGGIRDLEQGRRSPQWETALALAKALGVDCTAFTTPPTASEPQGRGRPPKAKPEASVKKTKKRKEKGKGK